MKLTNAEIKELQDKYYYLTNYADGEDADAPIDPLTYVDSNGDTLLHIAAQQGDLRTVELLLAAGLDVNKIGDMGRTALHYAETAEIARLLLAKGASKEIRDEFGQLPEVKT